MGSGDVSSGCTYGSRSQPGRPKSQAVSERCFVRSSEVVYSYPTHLGDQVLYLEDPRVTDDKPKYEFSTEALNRIT